MHSLLTITAFLGFLLRSSLSAALPDQLSFQSPSPTPAPRIHISYSESSTQAAIHARELIQYRSDGVGTIISNYPESHPDPTLRGLPIGLQEYFAPYPNGDLVLLVLPISAPYANVLGKEKMSLTISIKDELGERQREGAMWAANRRRMSVFGELEVLEDERWKQEAQGLYEDFHPDSPLWDTSEGPHRSFWGRLAVRKVYYFGGFGDRAAIGWLDMPTYRSRFNDTPSARQHSTCFHPNGINLYCEQPVDPDPLPHHPRPATLPKPDLQAQPIHHHHHHHHHHYHHHHYHHNPVNVNSNSTALSEPDPPPQNLSSFPPDAYNINAGVTSID